LRRWSAWLSLKKSTILMPCWLNLKAGKRSYCKP
jgi:hypothetical protein